MNKAYKVRASSWGRLFDCAHAWEGIHILGIKSQGSPRALLGTGIHAGTAVFDSARITGDLVSADDAVGVAIDAIEKPESEVDWRDSNLSIREATGIAAVLVTRYCLDVSPKYEFQAVELETKSLVIDCGGGIQIELTGTLDRSRLWKGAEGLGISDLKSGSLAVVEGKAKTKGHAAQIGTYELLYEHTTGDSITAPGEIIGLKTSGKPEIATGKILGAKEMMVGTEDSPGLIQYAAEMFRSGMFPPNNQSMLCSKKYCPRYSICKFKG